MSQQRANQLVEAGVWLRLSGDHAGARRLFEQALKLDPNNERARQMLATDPLQQPPPAAPPIQLTQKATPTPIPPTVAPAINPFTPPPGMSYEEAPPVKPYTLEGDWSLGIAPGASDEGVSMTFEPDPEPPPKPPRPLAPDAKSAWDSGSNPGFNLNSVYPNGADAMDLVSKDALPMRPVVTPPLEQKRQQQPVRAETTEADEIETLLNGAKDLIDLDDHSGAMDLILKASELSPSDPRVKKMREKSETTLQAMFESKIGRMDAVPKVVLKDDEIIWLNLDHRAGFVLAQIDGSCTFDDVFAVSGMSRLDTARILAQLVEEGVIQSS